MREKTLLFGNHFTVLGSHSICVINFILNDKQTEKRSPSEKLLKHARLKETKLHQRATNGAPLEVGPLTNQRAGLIEGDLRS